MLLNAVIIILREVIEASLIISLFLAFSQIFNNSRVWLLTGLFLGVISAAIYAVNIGVVSQWFDGVGQEVINAGIQIIIYLVLLTFLIIAMRPDSPLNKSLLTAMMMIGVIFATVREGSEIIIYIHGFVTVPELFQSVLLGSAIGAGIGISIGVCIYYILLNMPINISIRAGYVLTVLLAGSMISQTVQQLTQADWVISQYPIWDTSTWISEHSISGQLLYAVIGYEATPTAVQVMAYLSALFIIILFSGYSWNHNQRLNK
ncbi:MAG: FTR1 family protein [Pseudomonadota bacterium]|nr:FTR1 family protein [Pseudomonadota bacterium]MDO7710429.1 FTR1 family protein [Pseudomonadota bacterium]